VPLVERALKVLIDREVTPQLGLLKSTLLQLDSSFSERDYGVGSFREFADKLARQGLVSLKHQGRSTLVELPDPSAQQSPQAEPVSSGSGSEEAPKSETLTELLEQPDSVPQANASLGDGVALVRRVLAEAATEPRWPMYPRQFKQFLRNAQPDFDERKYGSIADLMRACQKDGLLRLERDRQGALRVFAGGSPRASVPHGWVSSHRENGSEQAAETATVVEVVPEVIAASASARASELRRDRAEAAFGREGGPVVDAQVTAIVEDATAEKPKRGRARKTTANGEKKKAAPRKKKAQ
jgi:OST-HTH/LOTUS domain